MKLIKYGVYGAIIWYLYKRYKEGTLRLPEGLIPEIEVKW